MYNPCFTVKPPAHMPNFIASVFISALLTLIKLTDSQIIVSCPLPLIATKPFCLE